MSQEAIKRPYVDYTYYKDEYGGTNIKTQNDFKRLESISEAFVDRVTFGRIQRLLNLTDSIRDAVCYVADTIAIQNQKKETAIKSESNDGYSVSYADAVNDTVLHKEMYWAVKSYLANTGLLNKGWVKEYDDQQ